MSNGIKGTGNITPRQAGQAAADNEATNQTGTELFQGYNIMHLSQKPDSGGWVNFKKFARFCWDPAYREKKRNEFLERAKTEIKNLELPKAATTIEEIENIAKTIKSIMETSDVVMPKNKKMELILDTINNSSEEVKTAFRDGTSTNLVHAAKSNYIHEHDKNEKLLSRYQEAQLLAIDVANDYKEATDYFNDQKTSVLTEISAALVQVAKTVPKEKVKSITTSQLSSEMQRKKIQSGEELDKFKMDLIKSLINGAATFDSAIVFVNGLIANPELNLSEKQGMALLIEVHIKYGDTEGMGKLLVDIAKSNIPEADKIELMLMAATHERFIGDEPYKKIEMGEKNIDPIEYIKERTMEAIDKMAIESSKDKSSIRSDLDEIRKTFKDTKFTRVEDVQKFQEDYAKAVIGKMVTIYKGPAALDVLEKNVAELLKFDSAIVLSKEQKADLIADVQILKKYSEGIKSIGKELLTETLIKTAANEYSTKVTASYNKGQDALKEKVKNLPSMTEKGKGEFIYDWDEKNQINEPITEDIENILKNYTNKKPVSSDEANKLMAECLDEIALLAETRTDSEAVPILKENIGKLRPTPIIKEAMSPNVHPNTMDFPTKAKNEVVAMTPEPLSKEDISNILTAAEKTIALQLAGDVDQDVKALNTKFSALKKEHAQINTQEDVNNYINDLMKVAIDYIAEEGNPLSLKEDVEVLLAYAKAIQLSEEQKTALKERVIIARIRKETMHFIEEMKTFGIDDSAYLEKCKNIAKEGDLRTIKDAFMNIQLNYLNAVAKKPDLSVDAELKFKEMVNILRENIKKNKKQ